jgi:lipid-A-disaccharide synthase
VDYPGFNLRIAEFAKKNGIRVHYYVSPQIWAWKQSRIHKIKRVVDHMYCILPFEKAFYQRFDMEVHYVGHPLVDAIKNFKATAINESDFRQNFNLSDRPILALLPGSRLQEIKAKLPIMLTASHAFKDMEILIAGAPNIPEKLYLDLANGLPIKVIPNRTYDLLNHAHLGIVTSGTATLETALFKVPQVVCYKGNPISIAIARRLIKVKYISLVNLIMDKEIVKELIQGDLTPAKINAELLPLRDSTNPKKIEMLHAYDQLEQMLGDGKASNEIASLIIQNQTG